jgi:hypothetical protein
MHAEKLYTYKNDKTITIEYGTINEVSGTQYVVQSDEEFFTASRAFSCIINPQVGDKVMFSIDQHDQSCILSIIDRPTDSAASLSFQGDVSINSQQGSISIAGDQGVQLASPKEVTMVAHDLHVAASKGTMQIDDLTTLGDQLTSHISKIRIFAKTIDSVADRLSQRLKNSFRMIEGVDQTRAGDVLTSIKNLFSLRSRQSAILAKKDIKIDAERIHMG